MKQYKSYHVRAPYVQKNIQIKNGREENLELFNFSEQI